VAPFNSIRWLAGSLLALLVWLTHGDVYAQQASEQTVKAGFVYNFVKFTQWPAPRDSERGPLLICTPGSQPLGGQFALLQGRPIGNRTIEIRSQVPASEWRDCLVLFFAEGDMARLDSAIRTLAGSPVLTVSDAPDFVQAGGMIGMRIDDNRVRFDVNLGAAQRAGIVLNSQMVKLAGQVLR
jgi:hypothetical protein